MYPSVGTEILRSWQRDWRKSIILGGSLPQGGCGLHLGGFHGWDAVQRQPNIPSSARFLFSRHPDRKHSPGTTFISSQPPDVQSFTCPSMTSHPWESLCKPRVHSRRRGREGGRLLPLGGVEALSREHNRGLKDSGPQWSLLPAGPPPGYCPWLEPTRSLQPTWKLETRPQGARCSGC